MCKAQSMVHGIIQRVEETNKTYNENVKKLKDVEAEILDIEHFIEKGGFDVIQGYYYAKSLQKLRNKRRELKNENKTLKILVDTLNKTIQLDFLKSTLSKVTSESQKLEHLTENQIYNPRKLKKWDKKKVKEYCNSL